MTQSDTAASRSIELGIALEADAETVWQALTDARELANWFPLEAEISPGEGGSVTLSWGPGMAWTTHITVWEPGQHLRWTDPVADGATGTPSAVDFELSTEAGSTTLRLVHSGFGSGDNWDEQYESTKAGWSFFLYHLRHYLEHHLGTVREMVWERQKLQGTREQVWARLVSSALLGGRPRAPEPGDGIEVRLGDGVYRGVVAVSASGRTLGIRLSELNEALLFIELEPGQQDPSCGFWLSTYGVSRLQTLRTALEEAVGVAAGG